MENIYFCRRVNLATGEETGIVAAIHTSRGYAT